MDAKETIEDPRELDWLRQPTAPGLWLTLTPAGRISVSEVRPKRGGDLDIRLRFSVPNPLEARDLLYASIRPSAQGRALAVLDRVREVERQSEEAFARAGEMMRRIIFAWRVEGWLSAQQAKSLLGVESDAGLEAIAEAILTGFTSPVDMADDLEPDPVASLFAPPDPATEEEPDGEGDPAEEEDAPDAHS